MTDNALKKPQFYAAFLVAVLLVAAVVGWGLHHFRAPHAPAKVAVKAPAQRIALDANALATLVRAGTHELHGAVVDQRDRPVAGARVWTLDNPNHVEVTNNKGEFLLHIAGEVASSDNTHENHAVTLRAEGEDGLAAEDQFERHAAYALLRLRVKPRIDVSVIDDKRDAPLAGAEVSDCTGARDVVLHTDMRGAASLLTWSQEPVLCVQAEGFGVWRQNIRVEGHVTHVEVRLRAGRSMAGRVLDSAGRPVVGASVTMNDFGEDASSFESMTTDEHGAWSTPALCAGVYVFAASDANHPVASSPRIVGDGFNPIDDIVIVLADGLSVHGVVLDANDNVAAGAHIVALTSAMFEREIDKHEADADTQGRFSMNGFLPGARRLQATLGAMRGEILVDLAAAGNVVVRLDQTAQTIRGVVQDANGGSVAGAAVNSHPSEGSAGLGMFDYNSTTADKNGVFELSNIRFGAYDLEAMWPGTQTSDTTTMLQHVEAGADNVVLTLHRGGTIKMQLAFSDGAAVTDKDDVRVQGEFGQSLEIRAFEHSIGGHLQFDTLVPGELRFFLVGNNFTPHSVHVDVVEGGTTHIGLVRLERGLSIEGTVRNSAGAPIPNAVVTRESGWNDDSEEPFVGNPSVVNTDSKGHYRLVAVTRGDTISAHAQGYGRSPDRVVKRGGKLDLVLTASGGIAGRVTRLAAPLAHARIEASHANSKLGSYTAISSGDGRYAFEALPAGPYILVANVGSLHVTALAKVTAGNVERVDFELPNVHNVRVTLADMPQDAAVRADLSTKDKASTWGGEPHRFNRAGLVIFTDVPSASYRVCAMPVRVAAPRAEQDASASDDNALESEQEPGSQPSTAQDDSEGVGAVEEQEKSEDESTADDEGGDEVDPEMYAEREVRFIESQGGVCAAVEVRDESVDVSIALP